MPSYPPRVIEAARLLSLPPVRLRDAAKRWAKSAAVDPAQKSLFGAPDTPDQSWALFLGEGGIATTALPSKPTIAERVGGLFAPKTEGAPSEFASGTLAAAASVGREGRWGQTKVYLRAVYDSLPEPKPTWDAWGADVLREAKEGGLRLAGGEQASAMDASLWEKSGIGSPPVRFLIADHLDFEGTKRVDTGLTAAHDQGHTEAAIEPPTRETQMQMPSLTGSEKQIAYAEDIRAKALPALDTYIARLEAGEGFRPQVNPRRLAKARVLRDLMAHATSAEWWIGRKAAANWPEALADFNTMISKVQTTAELALGEGFALVPGSIEKSTGLPLTAEQIAARAAILVAAEKAMGPGSLHERIAATLGWSMRDVQSLSLPSLRDLVRPVSPALAEEIGDVIQTGSHVKAPDQAAHDTPPTK